MSDLNASLEAAVKEARQRFIDEGYLHLNHIEAWQKGFRSAWSVVQAANATPNASLPPLGHGPRRKMVITIEVTSDFEKRLDNQWMVEREINADRWSWKWADEAAQSLVAPQDTARLRKAAGTARLALAMVPAVDLGARWDTPTFHREYVTPAIKAIDAAMGVSPQPPVAAANEKDGELRKALLQVTGSLGLIIKGAKADAIGHKENYEFARAVLEKDSTL